MSTRSDSTYSEACTYSARININKQTNRDLVHCSKIMGMSTIGMYNYALSTSYCCYTLKSHNVLYIMRIVTLTFLEAHRQCIPHTLWKVRGISEMCRGPVVSSPPCNDY